LTIREVYLFYMRIGIDARLYGPKNGGLGRYLEQIIFFLEEIDKENEYVIFLYKDNFDLYQARNKRFKKVIFPYRWYSLSEQINFPRFIRKEKVDLMHFPHFNVPVFYSKKFVLTIHDLIISHFPDSRATTLSPLQYRFKLFGYHFVLSQAVKKAAKIIAVSQATKDDILKFYPKIREKKIEVIYEGVSAFPSKNDFNYDFLLKKYHLPKPYLLYFGAAYPHKNLKRLLRSFKIILEKYQKNIFLALGGKEDFFYRRLKNYAKDLGLSKKIFFLGFVPDEDMPLIYKNALAYIFPSLKEGFGLPVLEAMSFGLPVVCSNLSSLPEIAGEAALYFNPYREDEIAEKIYLLISNEQLRQKLIERGKERIKKFNWRDCAENTLNIYKSLLSNKYEEKK